MNMIQLFSIAVIPTVLAITLHEAAHGWMAMRRGDMTAYMLGRVTLNPVKHIDLIGTVIVPTVVFLTTGFLFGWAKPVPIITRNLHNPRRDMVWVAIAGPAANVIMAVAWALIYHVAPLLGNDWVVVPLTYCAQFGVLINLVLALFNMLPLPPLDGGRVAVGILPYPLSVHLARLEPYGLFIIAGLLLIGAFNWLMQPVWLLSHWLL